MSTVTLGTLIIVLSLSSTAFGRTNLFRKPAVDRESLPPENSMNEDESTPPPSPTKVTQSQSTPVRGIRSRESSGGTGRNWSMVTRGNPIVSSSSAVRYLSDLLPGELRSARIPTSVIAFSEGKAPVLAELTSRSGKTYLLLGEATLEKASKRITVEFTKIRQKEKSEVFALKASALAEDGTLGLEGELQSGEAKYFLAELASAAAAGFADSTIKRSSNAFGNTVEEPSLDTHTKKALSTAMVRSADRFGEKLKNVTEYSLLEGPVTIQVLIQDQPKISHSGGK